MTETFDVVVVVGGVVGAATAFRLNRLGCGRVLLLERAETGSGGTAKSCAIVRSLAVQTDVDITPYRLGRFAEGEPLTGAYGIGSIS